MCLAQSGRTGRNGLASNQRTAPPGRGRPFIRLAHRRAEIDTGLTQRIRNVGSVAHQPAGFGKFTPYIDRGNRIPRRQMRQLDTPCGQKGGGGDEESVGPLTLSKAAPISRLVLALKDLYLQAHGASSRFYLSQCRLGLTSLLGGAVPRGRWRRERSNQKIRCG
jgi:hypothetical protein